MSPSQIKAVHIITNNGFTIFNKSFGITEQEKEPYSSLIASLFKVIKNLHQR